VEQPDFELVIPSLPGFALSSPLRCRGLGAAETADLWAELMSRLGYTRFGAVGSDWGAFFTSHLAYAHADRLLGAYLTLCAIPGLNPRRLGKEEYGVGEEEWWSRWRGRSRSARAHVLLNRDTPDTVAWALNDSPVGLAAIFAEKRRAWSDPRCDFSTVFNSDFVITTTCLYWFTQTAGSAARFYAESLREPTSAEHISRLVPETPVGVGVFPYEPVLVPQAVMRRYANLVHWSVFDAGGHFAPMEQPETFADDVRRFFVNLGVMSAWRSA
jgi:pimeloyl-ACP methyl ester carboxylesterase